MILTIGHSTMPAEEFAKLVQHHKVDAIWDTRSHPGSTKYPQYDKEAIKAWLPIKYEWIPMLGGWSAAHASLAKDMEVFGVDVMCYCHKHFPKQRIAAERPHKETDVTWWNQGLYDYSWFTMLPEFQYSVKALITAARTHNIAIMCSEAQWWRCHRSMIADHLVAVGSDAMHIMGNRQTPHSQVIGNRLKRYDPRIRAKWVDDNGRIDR